VTSGCMRAMQPRHLYRWACIWSGIPTVPPLSVQNPT